MLCMLLLCTARASHANRRRLAALRVVISGGSHTMHCAPLVCTAFVVFQLTHLRLG